MPLPMTYGVQELVCQERPLRGHLRSPRVPEECPEAVRALIDACIEADAPAERPSAYEIFVHLATRCAAQSTAHFFVLHCPHTGRYVHSIAGEEACTTSAAPLGAGLHDDHD